MSRPRLVSTINPEVFDSYYWYKEELISFARDLGLSSAGGKFEIHDRISHFLRTGKKLKKVNFKPVSNFDWPNESLEPDTVITDNYKNNQNVRAFFKKHVGDHFSFNIDFMNFMKQSVGLTLQDAVDFYNELMEARKQGKKQEIPDHNQFNLYVRTISQVHPELTKEQVTKIWLKKIEIPRPGSRGRGIVFEEADLDL